MSKWSNPTKQRKKARLNCERKIQHQSFVSAYRAMTEMQAAGRAAIQCRAYHCGICGFYHWGHPTGHGRANA